MMTSYLRVFLRSVTTGLTKPEDTVYRNSSKDTKFTVLTVSADLAPGQMLHALKHRSLTPI